MLTSVTTLQEFIGMATFLSPFIAALTASLHELLKKEIGFIWNVIYKVAFQKAKEADFEVV